MYRIIATNPDGSSYTIYDPAGSGALPVLAPRMTEALNEAGSLEFALVYGHTAFSRLIPKATYVTAELDGEELFYGRMLNEEPNPLNGQSQISFSGALSLLQDSELPADGKKEDGTTDYQTMTAEAFLRRCIDNHNAEVGNDPRRTFTVGTVNHPSKAEERVYEISSYTDTLSVLKQNLTDWYGGFLRVRPDGNGGHLIDWVEQYGDTDAGTLELGENIISIMNRIRSDDMVTAIRPVGKDGLVLSGTPVIDLYGQEDMQKYGRIVKSVQFRWAETEEELRTEANKFVSKLVNTYYVSSDIKMVDLKFLDGNEHGVKLGDVFTGILGLEGQRMTVATRNRDFENPQNDSVSLKNPKEFEGDPSGGSYSENRSGDSSSISGRSSRNSGAAGYAYKYIHEFQDRLELNTKKISISAEQLELHANQLVETANQFVQLSHREETLENKFGDIEGTGLFQNASRIVQVAGKFRYDATLDTMELVEGTQLEVHDRNGAMITVGTRLTELGTETNRLGQKIATFEGSALWSQKDNITGVVGEFDVITDSNGRKTLRVKSGGGLKILRDNVEFGVYDDGSLTAGVIVDRINNGAVTIAGSKILLNGNTTISGAMEIDGSGRLWVKKILSVGTGFLTIIKDDHVTTKTVQLNSGGGISFIGSGTGERYSLDVAILKEMIKTAEVNGNGTVLTLTRFDGTTLSFSSATSLSGAWSGNTYTVTASPQGRSNSVTINAKIEGTSQYNNFSASAGTYDSSSNFTARDTLRGYLVEHVSGANSYVDVASATSGGTVYARVSTRATYNAGNSAGNSAGQLTGWSEAYAKVSWPGSNTSSASMTVKAPAAAKASSPNQQSVTYTLSSDNNVAYIKHGGVIVAQLTHNKYSSGYNAGNSAGYSAGVAAVTITSVTRSGAQVTATASNGKTGSLTLTAHTNCKAGVTGVKVSGNWLYGMLYYKDGSTYKSVTSGNKYWFYSSTRADPTTYYD